MENKELSPIEELISKLAQINRDINGLFGTDSYPIRTRVHDVKDALITLKSTYKKQIEELQSQLAEKDAEIKSILEAVARGTDLDASLKWEGERPVSKFEQLQSELTELKEKHKRDVVDAYITCYNYDSKEFEKEQAYQDEAFKYYNETHKTK